MTVVDLEPRIDRERGFRDQVPEHVAEELAARIMAAAGDVARQEAVFLELVGEFDAVGAVAWWAGIASTAHWLSWACSIAPGTAREHVRVARALRRMPATRKAFALGELTFSKVREITRVADELARAEQARQLQQKNQAGPAEPAKASAAEDSDPAAQVDDSDQAAQAQGAQAAEAEELGPTAESQPVGQQTAAVEPSEPGQSELSGQPEGPGSVARTGLEDLDERALVELARACTASQLARSIGGWRAVKGTSRQRRSRQRVTWRTQDDGNIHFTAVLPPEEGAALIAAVQAATEANTDPEPTAGHQIPDDQVSELGRDERLQRTRVEAVTEIATHYLGSMPADRSGEDRTMVILEINAEALATAERHQGQPDTATTEQRGGEQAPHDSAHDSAEDDTGFDGATDDHAAAPGIDNLDAGTDSEAPERSRGNAVDPITVPACRVRGGAALEPSDAYRAACDATLLGIIINQHGMPLAVGRQQRLVTKHQRRALMIRDHSCQYPGCTRTRHLKAHHRISWLAGGPTDLDNLILLCQTHHTRVHEDHLSITTCPEPGCTIRWQFTRPDGTTITPTIAGTDAPDAQYQELREKAARLRTAYQHIHTTKDPDANRVFPVGGGEGFLLANCVDALFAFTQPHPTLFPTAA